MHPFPFVLCFCSTDSLSILHSLGEMRVRSLAKGTAFKKTDRRQLGDWLSDYVMALGSQFTTHQRNQAIKSQDVSGTNQFKIRSGTNTFILSNWHFGA
jgi:hypothetical protein